MRRFKEGEAIPNAFTKLSEREARIIESYPEAERPMRLALLRFEEERAKLKARVTVEIRQAFRLGYLAGAKDRGGA